MKISITLIFLSLVAFLQCTCTVAAHSTVKLSRTSNSVGKEEPSAPKEDPSNSSSKQAVQGVITLNSRNFESSISDGNVWLVEFYSPWCGYVQRHSFQPLFYLFSNNRFDSVSYSHSIDCTLLQQSLQTICSNIRINRRTPPLYNIH